jgi:hypothetical protein
VLENPPNRSHGKDDPDSTPAIHAAAWPNSLAATGFRGVATQSRRASPAISNERMYNPAVLLHTIFRPNL